MPPRKKPFKAPSPIFVLFSTDTHEPLATFSNRKDLDEELDVTGLAPDEVVVEYYLPPKRKPKSKELS